MLLLLSWCLSRGLFPHKWRKRRCFVGHQSVIFRSGPLIVVGFGTPLIFGLLDMEDAARPITHAVVALHRLGLVSEVGSRFEVAKQLFIVRRKDLINLRPVALPYTLANIQKEQIIEKLKTKINTDRQTDR